MALNLIQNGDLPDADPVMENYNHILNNISLVAVNMSPVPSLSNWTYDDFADETKIDTANTNMPYAGVGDAEDGAWICTLYDQFDDSSLDTTTKWSTTLVDPSSDTIATITEDTQKVQLYVESDDGGLAASALLQAKSTALDMKGQDGEFMAFMYYNLHDIDASGSSGSSIMGYKIYIGSAVVYDYENYVASTNESDYVDLRLVFNNSAQTVDVYTNGTKVASAIDISAQANWNPGIQAYADSASTGDDLHVTVNIYTCGYVKDGDTNTPDFVSVAVTPPSTSTSGHIYVEMGYGTVPTIQGAINGSTYVTANNGEIQTLGSGTSFKVKLREQVPAITNTTRNIKRIDRYSAHYG